MKRFLLFVLVCGINTCAFSSNDEPVNDEPFTEKLANQLGCQWFLHSIDDNPRFIDDGIYQIDTDQSQGVVLFFGGRATYYNNRIVALKALRKRRQANAHENANNNKR